MKCPAEERLSAFADRELAPDELAAIEAHVAACAACAEQVAAFRQLAEVVARAPVPAVSADEWAAAWRAIAGRTVVRPERAAEPAAHRLTWLERLGWRERLGWLRWAAAAAVLALALVLWDRLVPTSRPPDVSAKAERCVVEYLEPAEGYTSAFTYDEQADVALITVVPAEP